MSARFVLAACFVAAVGTAPALAEQLPADGALPFSTRPYAKLFASVTCATAAVVERHLGYRASWPMFLVAGYVSASRITDNRHFMSDVLFGAALGMASGWTVVGRHGRDDFTLIPTPIRGGAMLAGSWSPKP